MIRCGIDTGGTFTDLVAWTGDHFIRRKVPSTPDDPSRAVLSAIEAVAPEGSPPPDEVIHGSTVATNALLEGRGALTAVVVTDGFEDLIEIGRQERPHLYELHVRRPPALVPAERRFVIDERMTAEGEALRSPSPEALHGLRERLRASGVEAVAVCLLHSYRDPAHEETVAAALRDGTGLFVVTSSGVLPEYREFERFTTAIVSAQVTPIMGRYLRRLEESAGSGVWVMQSAGGIVPASAAQREAARTVLSGPAAGVVGGHRAALDADEPRAITFDMGGTSTDVALCPGAIPFATEILVGERTLALPSVDIATVGAGGGSIAWVDPGGALRVGPRSAGADPGPVAYGKGDEITVTDANLFLGRIRPTTFLGGEMRLDVDRVRDRMEPLAAALGLEPWQAAEGVLEVARAEVARALRSVSLARGRDPRGFVLVAFGGGGPLHALELARELGMPKVIVPTDPGLTSAIGLLASDRVAHASRTVLDSSTPHEEVFLALEDRTATDLGGAEGEDRIDRSVDLRYAGQSYEIPVSWSAEGEHLDAFHDVHRDRFGVSDPQRVVEEVTLRVVRRRPVGLPWVDAPDAVLPPKDPETAPVLFGGEPREVPVQDRDHLHPGDTLDGPALVTEYSSTTYLPPGSHGKVHPSGSLILTWKEDAET